MGDSSETSYHSKLDYMMASSRYDVEPRHKIVARIPIYQRLGSSLRDHGSSSSTCSSRSSDPVGAGSRMESLFTGRSGKSTLQSPTSENTTSQLESMVQNMPQAVDVPKLPNSTERAQGAHQLTNPYQPRFTAPYTSGIINISEILGPTEQAQQPKATCQSGSLARTVNIDPPAKASASDNLLSNAHQPAIVFETWHPTPLVVPPLERDKAAEGTGFGGYDKPATGSSIVHGQMEERVLGIERQLTGLVGQFRGISGHLNRFGGQLTEYGGQLTAVREMFTAIGVCKEKQMQILYQLSSETGGFDFESSISSTTATLQDNDEPLTRIGSREQEKAHGSQDTQDKLAGMPARTEEMMAASDRRYENDGAHNSNDVSRNSRPRRLHFKTRNLSAALQANDRRTLFGQPGLPTSTAALFFTYPDLSAELVSLKTSQIGWPNSAPASRINLHGNIDADRYTTPDQLRVPARMLNAIRDWFVSRQERRIVEEDANSSEANLASSAVVSLSDENDKDGDVEGNSVSKSKDDEIDEIDSEAIYASALKKVRNDGIF